MNTFGFTTSQRLRGFVVLCALVSSVGPNNASVEKPGSILIEDLRTEGVACPLGIEQEAPRFSWRYKAGENAPRGFLQSGYRVQVASTPEKLQTGVADMWDSGKQEGSDTLNVLYAGRPLQSGSRYFWRATGFDAKGNAYISEPQWFETGLRTPKDWKNAHWIGARSERPETIPARLVQLQDYSVETKFRVLEGKAVVLIRGDYSESKGYRIELTPGNPGRLSVFRNGKNAELLKDYTVPDLTGERWHSLRIVASGDEFTFSVDDRAVGSGPLRDQTRASGSVALGSRSADKKPGLVEFDDFKLSSNGRVVVAESFDDPVLFAFQEFFFSNNQYARVKNGALEIRGINSYLEPKSDLAAPRFRKTFSTGKGRVIRARAYVSGAGYYRFWLNGRRLDDYELHPGFASYDKTAYYTVYDITDRIERDNVLAFELGRGWYGMTTPTLWGETFSNDWMAEPALRSLVTIDYEDGTRQTVCSDDSFKTAPGPVVFDSVKAGEIYDARKEQPGWNTTGFDDRSWTNAVPAQCKLPSTAPGLTSQLFEPVRSTETFRPVKIEKVDDETDTWLIDFGKNLAGTVQMTLNAARGQEIRLTYVEKIHPKGAARERWNNFDAQSTGSFQRDIYIAKGDGEETYESSYSYKGFQFVRVEGLRAKPEPDQFLARALNSDMRQVGTFHCSSDLWNKIWEAGRRSIQSNMQSIPTDCPQWEKLGWTCDDAGPFYGMAYNYDLRKLYEKRLQDYADDISADGSIRNVIPSTWAKGADPAWVGSYVNLVWKHYLTYGDPRVISVHYENLKRYIKTLIDEGERSEKPPLLTKPRRALGDWVSPDGNIPPEGALIYYNLYFYRYTCMMADLAKVIHRDDDSRYYSALVAELKEKFNEYHFDTNDGCYYSSNRTAGVRQAPQAIALAFGLVPAEKVSTVVETLASDITTKRDGHFWVGILGMEAIADALSDNGRDDVAYAAHLKDDYPSLGNMIREGATTLWEDYRHQARSLNHKMFATPLGWMARYVAGLRVEGVTGNGPGFREVIIAPHPVPNLLRYAELNYDSVVGRYRCGWTANDQGMIYNVTVPPNARASFQVPMPYAYPVTVKESGSILWQKDRSSSSVPGISVGKRVRNRLELNLGSGTYKFEVQKEIRKEPYKSP